MCSCKSKIYRQLQLTLEFEWFSHHSDEMQIRQFGAISSFGTPQHDDFNPGDSHQNGARRH
jgi:hypothetical protein